MSELRKRAEQTLCPICAATPGAPCNFEGNLPAKHLLDNMRAFHGERYEAARDSLNAEIPRGVSPKEFRLRGHRVVLYDNGNIWFKLKTGEEFFTSAAELAFILQEFQAQFGGIPVKLDGLRAWIGTPAEP